MPWNPRILDGVQAHGALSAANGSHCQALKMSEYGFAFCLNARESTPGINIRVPSTTGNHQVEVPKSLKSAALLILFVIFTP